VEHSCFGRLSGHLDDDAMEMTTDNCGGVESLYGHSQASLALSSLHGPREDSLRELSSQVVAYHFCQVDNAPTCLVPEFVHSVAAQMAQAPRFAAYHRLVASRPGLQRLLSLPGCVADPSAALVNGILDPLRSLADSGRLSGPGQALLVVDGLCDAELHRPDYGPTLASFLSSHLGQFPHWLKVVCTVRSGAPIGEAVARSLPFQRLSLDKTDVDERLNKDMSDYVALRINRSRELSVNITPTVKVDGSPQARITHHLTMAARGCFLYVKMALDLLERGHLVVKSASFNVLPTTLSQIYLLEFNLRFPSEK